MKLCAVYKSPKRADTYLYVAKRDDFERVPKALMTQFGRPKFVMLVPFSKHEKLANIDKAKFISKLEMEGFYLQMPPKTENLLEEHLKTHTPIAKKKRR